MQYRGSALKLAPGDVKRCSDAIRVDEAALRAVIEIETGNRAGFLSDGRPMILFEPHLFYKEVSGAKRTRALREGVAKATWGGPGSYPKTHAAVWAQYMKAAAIDETAAIRSTSWGLGQVLGSNYKVAGYNSPQEMVSAFCESELNQLGGMCNFMIHNNLVEHMRRFPSLEHCAAFARIYNGPSYAKNNYHTKLRDAYNRWSKKLSLPIHKEDGILRIGDTGSQIKAMQQKLKDLGYSILVDGKFGTGTRATILAWKANEGLSLTPEMSPEDLRVLEHSSPMPIAEERATATVKDLKESSTIVADTSNLKTGVTIGGTVVGGAQIADSVGLLDRAQEVTDKAYQARTIFDTAKETLSDLGVSRLLTFVSDHAVVILIACLLIGWFVINRIQKNRLEMHRKAEIG